MKAVYIGASIDTIPIIRLDFISEFVYVDSQPYSAFGTLKSNIIMSDGYDGYYRPKFFNSLCKHMEIVGMNLESINLNVIDFKNKEDLTLRYYINTAVPDHNKSLENEISTVDVLIVSGHDPHYSILDSVTKKLMFVGFQGTVFSDCGEYEDGSLTQSLHDGVTLNKFSSFTYICSKGMETFDTWAEFVVCSSHS